MTSGDLTLTWSEKSTLLFRHDSWHSFECRLLHVASWPRIRVRRGGANIPLPGADYLSATTLRRALCFDKGCFGLFWLPHYGYFTIFPDFYQVGFCKYFTWWLFAFWDNIRSWVDLQNSNGARWFCKNCRGKINFSDLGVTDDVKGQVKGQMFYRSRLFYGMRYNIKSNAFYR